MSILQVTALVAGYEPGLSIVRGASIHAAEAEIVVILGPNGAGKSSLIKAIAGLVPVSAGQVVLDGRDIIRVSAHLMVRRGLAFVPQTENIFPLMTVEENLRVAGGGFCPALRSGRALTRCSKPFPTLPANAR